MEDLFGISCRFECETAVLIHDDAMATHLYHIAQEAVNNAIKHGQRAQHPDPPDRRERLRNTADHAMTAQGFAEDRANAQGMGLHIMSYRAGMIGGRLEVSRNPVQGTCVTCIFPIEARLR